MKYVILAYIFIFALNPILSKKHLKLYYIITAVTLAALAYFVIPLPAMDLYRYTEIIGYFKKKSLAWAMEQYGSSNPVAFLFLYVISYLPTVNFLPAITVLLVYGFSLALLYKAGKYLNAGSEIINIAFIFLMLNLNYCYVIDVVRIYIAYAILAYFLFVDLVEKKHRIFCFTVYVILCYFHYAIIVFIFMRMLLIVAKRLEGELSVIFTAFVPPILFVSYYLLDNFAGDLSVLSTASDRIDSYKDYEVFGKWQFLASIIRIVMFILIEIIVVMIFNELKKKSKSRKLQFNCNNINNYSHLCVYAILSVITFINNYQYVLRTPYFIQMLISLPVLFVLLNLKKFNIKYYYAFAFLIICESIVHFAYLLIYVYGTLNFSFAL